jgi:hypothetical protein
MRSALIEQLALEHRNDLRREAQHRRHDRDATGIGIRQRLGWLLIDLGVHLAAAEALSRRRRGYDRRPAAKMQGGHHIRRVRL